jgi:hypothetical protein
MVSTSFNNHVVFQITPIKYKPNNALLSLLNNIGAKELVNFKFCCGMQT